MPFPWEATATITTTLTGSLVLFQIIRGYKIEDLTHQKFNELNRKFASLDKEIDKKLDDKLEKLEVRIDKNRETVIHIYEKENEKLRRDINMVCDERQSHCSDLVTKDIERNRCEITKLRLEKEERHKEHMRNCHPDGCPQR